MKAIVFALALALAPNGAEAQQTDPEAFWGATLGAGIPMLAVDGVLFGLAIDAWASGHYGIDEEWAIVELVWGAIHLAGVGVAIGLSTLAYDPVSLAFTFGVPLGVFGLYFVTHALLSLFGESTDPPVDVAVSANERGFLASASGTF